jgi:transposase
MDNIGLDLHTRESQHCILTADGEVIERRIVTSPERFSAVPGGRPRARVLLEASTESEWVAWHLERLGHEVIVADPNFAPMYATRARRVKTDRRDARTLAEACRLVIKALVRRDGLRLPSGEPQHTAAQLARLSLPAALAGELGPLLALLAPLNAQIDAADQRLETPGSGDPVVARLTTAPTIGPVTAVAFVATLDDITRFANAHQVEAFLGLTPSEKSSGEQQRRGSRWTTEPSSTST